MPRFYLYELPGKGPIVAYDAVTGDEAWAASAVVQQVFRDFSVFHQIGVTPDGANRPGFHGWELWRPIDDATMQSLLAQCEELYEKHIS